MAEYFIARGLPVPAELRRNPLTDWRRLATIAVIAVVLYIGFKITDIDVSRANPEYAFGVLTKLVSFDWSVLGPQNEFETFWDGALGLMIVTIFLGIMGTALALVIAIPLSFLGARNIMAGNPITNAIYVIVRLALTVIRSIDVLIVVIVMVILFGLGNAAGVFGIAFHNIGVMGKLYSEAIEGIDSGPLEAITATGANRPPRHERPARSDPRSRRRWRHRRRALSEHPAPALPPGRHDHPAHRHHRRGDGLHLGADPPAARVATDPSSAGSHRRHLRHS